MNFSSSSPGRINYAVDHSPCSPTYSLSRHLPCSSNGNSSPASSHHASSRGSRSDLFSNGVPQTKLLNHNMSDVKLFVVLHSFKSRRVEDLSLKAGFMVEIIDTSDTDWWRVRCPITGSVGYMPSAYLAQLHPGEQAQQVTQLCSIYVVGGQTINLMKDQIVIQMPAEKQERLKTGEVMIRTGDTSHAFCGIAQSRYLCSV